MANFEAIEPTDLGPVARKLTSLLIEQGVLKTTVKEPHVHVQSALEALIRAEGDAIMDLAWRNGKEISRHDESKGFCGATGKEVQKRCHRLVLTIVPERWTPRSRRS